MSSTAPGAVRDFFDSQTYLQRNPIIPIRAAIVADLLAGVANARVLDLGCGDGSISRPLLVSANKLTLVDFSSRMLETAQTATPPGAAVEFVQADIMGFTAQTPYDVVICVGVLAHVGSVPDAVACVSRALRPGGLAVIQITDDASPLGRLLNVYYATRDSREYQLNRTTRQRLDRIARANCLRPVARRRYGALMPGLGHLPRTWEESVERGFAKRARLSRLGAELLILCTKHDDQCPSADRVLPRRWATAEGSGRADPTSELCAGAADASD